MLKTILSFFTSLLFDQLVWKKILTIAFRGQFWSEMCFYVLHNTMATSNKATKTSKDWVKLAYVFNPSLICKFPELATSKAKLSLLVSLFEVTTVVLMSRHSHKYLHDFIIKNSEANIWENQKFTRLANTTLSI